MLALLTGVLLTLTACSGGGAGGAGGAAAAGASGTSSAQERPADEPTSSPTPSGAVVTFAPGDGATGVPVDRPVEVTVERGELTKVVVTDPEGSEVDGTLRPDGSGWTSTTSAEDRLWMDTEYTVTATATGEDGRSSTSTASFTTTAPEETFIGYFTPEDGTTVGVGMPVSINFDHPISDEDKAGVERGITVSTSSGQEVVGHWFSDTRLDLRPEEYWEAGSTVSLSLRLRDVEGAPGVYGTQSKDVTFRIGREQISTVDAAAHTMTVERDGEVIRTIPVSTGADDNATWSGALVVSEKLEETRMNGDTVGFDGEYDIADVPHAIRLTSSGTFLHGNYWTPESAFGTANTSHGCIGLADVKGGDDDSTDAAWFFDNTITGDVVNVVNSDEETVAPDNGFNGWNMSWSEWVEGSALH
ncbi:L,D-transpeptidase [Allostreptomyces psammosilenae]|uniref:L,D-transpeptidase n=1 Tax=Allostreptomyces psammosilenae TaxID=1892865 RepID=UPI0028AAED93|nr:Ig-like domain-containing protein [Allostreptomyces psammosilenae]